MFPIKSVSGNAALEYVSYELGKNTYDVQECLIQGLTYSAPLRIKVKLVLFDRDSNFEEVKDIKEGERILIDDGKIKLKVLSKKKDILKTKVLVGGNLSSNKGVNLPNLILDTKPITKKDRNDLFFKPMPRLEVRSVL